MGKCLLLILVIMTIFCESVIRYEHLVVFDSGITYVQIVEFDERILLITRIGNKKWLYILSEDMGHTWSSPKDFIVQNSTSYGQIYCLIQPTGTKWVKIFHIAGIDDGEDNNKITYSALDIETLLCYDKENGTQIANLNVAGKSFDDGIVLFSATSGYRLRLLDIAGSSPAEAIFTISEHLISNQIEGEYKIIIYDLITGTSQIIPIANHGGYFNHTYSGGAYIRQKKRWCCGFPNEGIYITKRW